MEQKINKIQGHINDIYALANILHLLFEEIDNFEISVNPHCVASFGKMITKKVLLITDILDNHTPSQENTN